MKIQKSLSSFVRTVSLRTLLVIIVVGVSLAGLIASSAAVSALMREAIYSQVDKDLITAARGWARNEDLLGESDDRRPPSEYTVISYGADGTAKYFNPDLEAIPRVEDLVVDGTPQTVDTVRTDNSGAVRRSSEQWRAVATRNDGSIIVVAKKIARENAQIQQLSFMQIGISLIVSIIIYLISFICVKAALRPLREVERTARQIAAGDLDKRVPVLGENTEVGELSKSLNIMLGRLQESIETARDKENQMRRFVGDASHELRTPLTSLRGYTELYRSGATDDVDLVLGKIDAESKRMSLLVEDLLALTRAEGNRLEMHTVDLLELCMSVGSTARAAFAGRTIDVRPKTSGIPLVNGDPDRLHQVLLNLVSNGMRHAGDDATVTIQLRDGDGFIYIDVIDDGKGMEDEVAAHIFERFYRADSSRTRDTGGSGLGLAIAKSLVEQHGGTLSVTSELGVGSTFTVALPAVPQPADAPSDPTAEPATFTGTAVPVSEKKAKKKLRTKPWSRSKSKEKSRGDSTSKPDTSAAAEETKGPPQDPDSQDA